MTSEDVRSQLDRVPFVSFRLHLVSGKTVDINSPGEAWMMQHTVMVLQPRRPTESDPGYNVVALRNIEMIEQLGPMIPAEPKIL
jgi:hypothetical protein